MPYRRKLTQAERDEREAMLTAARRKAITVTRDGRTFSLLRLPDRYGHAGPAGGVTAEPDALDRPSDAD